MKLATVFLGITIFLSCSYKQDFIVNVEINNMSNVAYDSVGIYVYPDNEITFYNVKPGDKIVKDFEYKNFEYKRGDALASGIYVFQGDEYFYTEGGIIDVPFGLLEDHYEYYIYNDYVTTKKGFVPENLRKKQKISEFISGN